MVNRLRLSLLISGIVLGVTLSACGGSSSGDGIPSDAVVVVDHVPITRTTLNHWMASFAGGDFYEHHAGQRAPRGLVADPPDYQSCAAAANQFAAANGHPRSASDASKINGLCHQLYSAIKGQVLTFLISVEWRIDEAAKQGIAVSSSELNQALKRLIAEQFPKEGQFEAYLADREWALSDELYQLKRNLLTGKLIERIQRVHGNGTAGELAFIKLVQANAAGERAQTDCRVGYIVPDCRQYNPKTAVAPTSSPDILLEQLSY